MRLEVRRGERLRFAWCGSGQSRARAVAARPGSRPQLYLFVFASILTRSGDST